MRGISYFICMASLLLIACGSSVTGGNDNQAVCGNGMAEAGEVCDGLELTGQTCETLGHPSGSLVCSATCQFDVSGCIGSAACGNGVQGLLAHWALDGEADEPIGGYNGTQCGVYAYEDGVVGQSVSYDQGWMTTELQRPSAGTIAMWFRLDLNKDYQQLFGSSSNNEEFECWIYNDGNLKCRSTETTFYAEPNTWYHFTYTWDDGSGVAKAYINGVDVSAGDYMFLRGSDTLFFGADDPDGEQPFEGDLDEILVFDRALSASEVEELFSSCAEE